MASIRALVVDTASRLGRSSREVEPFVDALKENWYDSVDAVADASADDLASLGIPRRFAVELIQDAGRGGGKGGGGGGGKRDKGGKGKGKSKGKNDSKGKNGGGDLRHTIPIDLQGIRSDFKFRPKLLGGKGGNIHHIQDQTGVRVDLNGNDDDGYLEFVLTSNDDRNMDKASSMCEDLIETVFDEFDEHQDSGGKGGGKSDRRERKGKGKEKGKDKGKGKGKKGKRRAREGEVEERVPIDNHAVDAEFGLRAKLVGQGGRNVNHIESSSGARVSVEHDDGDGMAFNIIATDQAKLDAAKEMCLDLLDTVLKEGGIIGKKEPRSSGGKGKGKRKGRDDEDRAAKAPRNE